MRSEVSSLLEPRALALSVVSDRQGLFAFRNLTPCERSSGSAALAE
jgi:hypothetical protein